MVKEHTRIRIKTKFGTQDFVFTSRLTAIKFVMDESRREEVINFSVDYFFQLETTDIGRARHALQGVIDAEGRLE